MYMCIHIYVIHRYRESNYKYALLHVFVGKVCALIVLCYMRIFHMYMHIFTCMLLCVCVV